MSSTTDGRKEGFRACAFRGCTKQGTHFLEVELVKRKGWFCDSCAADLRWQGIATEEETSVDSVETLQQEETNQG